MGNALANNQRCSCYAPCLNVADALRADEEDDEGSLLGTGQKRNKNVFARAASVLASSDRVMEDLTAASGDISLADVMKDARERDAHLEREEQRLDNAGREFSLDNGDNSSQWSFGEEQQVDLMTSQGFHTTHPDGHAWQGSPGAGGGAIHGQHQAKVEPGDDIDSPSASFSSEGSFLGFQEVDVQRERTASRRESANSNSLGRQPSSREPLQLPVMMPRVLHVP